LFPSRSAIHPRYRRTGLLSIPNSLSFISAIYCLASFEYSLKLKALLHSQQSGPLHNASRVLRHGNCRLSQAHHSTQHGPKEQASNPRVRPVCNRIVAIHHARCGGARTRGMDFVDRTLKCADCGSDFVFTAGEQLFFHDKQFKNDPKRCKNCKAKRSSGPGGVRSETRTNCSECGMETTVPFKPTQGRPVLCRQCFQQKRTPQAS
jgi:CxxC-x17-CxxC domain-containing protein